MRQGPMSYYFLANFEGSFADAIDRVRAALREEGFGIVSEIDLQKTMKEKLGIDIPPYTILGACNPTLAYEALKLEDKVGTMLPCNVVVQQKDAIAEVAAIDPVASMQSIDNQQLKDKAGEVGLRLQRVIEQVRTSSTPKTEGHRI